MMKKKLEDLIYQTLNKLIGDEDYVYWDLPYHSNTGDLLIYKGTLEYLATKKGKCLNKGSLETLNDNKVRQNTTIIIHGGGNFGDIYYNHNLQRIKLIEKFKQNKIIFLPQSIHYNSVENLKNDFDRFKEFKNLFILVRDNESLKITHQYYKTDKTLLCPDMAFCISSEFLLPYKNMPPKFLNLRIKRIDKEKIELNENILYHKVCDWPLFNKKNLLTGVLYLLKKTKRIISNQPINFFMQKIYIPYNINSGLKLIANYENIYSDRLHGIIAAILLNKNAWIYDNCYHKSTRFFITFLEKFSSKKLTLIQQTNELSND